ncbi:MAG: FecR family protein [Tannerella sp.]|jgi:ferric-dicitrate binding protein FerR (iron transport regulator)|nr:FecR family protein [Tannerella sp.]
MVFREKEDIVTDQAWGHLYERLENDGLLPGDGRVKQLFWQTATFKWAAAVAVVLCVLSGWYMMRYTDAPSKDLLVLHNEANAPTLAKMLEDGSVVYLSEQTSLRYPDRFADNKREVILDGEAFFEVSKNAERPFLINTDLATIEVVGTSFNVKSNDPSSFLLSVRDGEVRVTLKRQQQVVSVKAGETALFDSDQLQLLKTGAHRFDEYIKRIHFKDERLDNIARIINMNSDSLQLSIAPGLEGRLLTFTTSGSSPSTAAELISLALHLQYSQQENTIYISQRE